MDVLYFLRHSDAADIEIRYSLRSIERYFPDVRKVWIFGDRPTFISEDTTLIEHVPHERVSRALGFRTPITNFFRMLFASSLIPDLDQEYLWFCDDFILISDLSLDAARTLRFIEDLDKGKQRGRGLWLDSLWRTYELLKRLGYPTLNFETHTPTYYRREWVLDAYSNFRDFVTEDRWFGMLGPTAILNHAISKHRFHLSHLATEGSRAGFWGNPPTFDQVLEATDSRLFLNFDDMAFGDGIRRFLQDRFPERSRYEKAEEDIRCVSHEENTQRPRNLEFPAVVMKGRDDLGRYLNHHGLLGEGVEVGVLTGKFSVHLLNTWKGRMLHCVDAWRDFTADVDYIDKNNVSQDRHENNYRETIRALSPYADRHEIHRALSKDASKSFRDGSLDFVYLDAQHHFDAVIDDLNSWAPKVRSGGIISGHDYLDGVLPSGHFEVKRAVDGWANARNLSVVCSGEHVWRSWIIHL